MVLLYNIFIWAYQWLLKGAALRNKKARAWVAGRRGLFTHLEQQLGQNTYPVIWVHSASTGEFEQAKPLIEAFRRQFPQYKILASFFSPSGYEAAANYTGIDYCFYLPADTAANAKKFVQTVKPALVLFSKYDFWYHYLKSISEQGIPLLLISAIFRPEQPFFRAYGGFQRSMLRCFTHIFVQDKASVELLHSIGILKCSTSGDTRFDRVQDIVQDRDAFFADTADVRLWIGERSCVVAGSTWSGDEELIAAVQRHFPELCWLIVPHEINAPHINELTSRFPDAIRYSQQDAALAVERDQTNPARANKDTPESSPLAEKHRNSKVMIVDAMGLLSRLYSLATITYVGGGFTKDGIHNTLEAAVWGKPVIIGPNYKKYREAKELITAGGAFSVANAAQLQQQIGVFTHNKAALEAASEKAKRYVQNGAGATAHIVQFIQEKRLLTN